MLCLAPAVVHAGARRELAYRTWTADDGLPQKSVYAFAQTPDGYLWIATLDGIVRFDGVRMTVFNRSTFPEMGSNRCLALHVDRRGALWIGTEDGGVMRMEGGRFRTWGPRDGVDAPVSAILESDDGALWIRTVSGVLRFDGERWSRPADVVVPPGFTIVWYCFVWARDGEYRILERDGRLHAYALPPEKTHPYRFISREANGATWLHIGDELWRFDRGTVTRVPAPRPFATDAAAAIVLASGDHVWALQGTGLSVRAGGRWYDFPRSAPLVFPRPLAMFEDREGSLWIGGDPGLVQARPTPIRVLAPEAPDDGNIYPIAEDAAGRVWVGAEGFASIYERERFTSLADVQRRTWGGRARAFAPEPDGSVLVGTDGGRLLRRRAAGWEVLHEFGATVSAIERDRGGVLWVATWNGLFRQQGREWIRYGTAQGLAGDHVRVLLASRDGSLWVGSYGGVSRIGAGGIERWTEADGLSSSHVRALHEDERGVLWIGTYDAGLVRFDGTRFTPIRRRNGLFDDGVFAILDDGAGRYWMSCNRGIWSVPRSQLDAFAAGVQPSVSSRPFGKADGMRSAECNGGAQPSGFRRRDGTLWFPTQDGIAIVDPRAVPAEPAPPNVLIESAATGDRALAPGAPVELGPRERSLEVLYTAMTLVRSDQVRFRYRLEPLETEWIEAGTRRIAHWSALPPGRYVLRVAAAAAGGVFGPPSASLAVHVAPRLWETGWFRAGLALLVVAVAGFAYHARVMRLHRRRGEQDAFARRLIESQEAERKRIAGELHDGIGQTLVVIRNRALMGLRDGADDAARRRQMNEISSEASAGIEDVRKIAYNLRPYQLDRLGLGRALEAVVEQVAAASGIPIAADIPPLDGVFAQEDEINVYRIVQEGLSNVVRHAAASSGRVSVGVVDGQVEIAIEDDGRGFDPAALPAGRAGHGLAGIAERARILGGSHAVRTIPGGGTRVVVLLPRKDGHP